MPANDISKSKIVEVQRRLRLLGYALGNSEIDGIMGPQTSGAIRKFQQDRNLLATGIIDEETWQELVDAGYKIGDRLLYLKNPPFRGDDVKTLQLWLKTLGFYKYDENGIFCEKTHKALTEFQKNMKINTDSILGGQTLQHLKSLKRIIESHESSNYPYIRDFSRIKNGEGFKVIFDYGESINDISSDINYFKDKIYICRSIAGFCRDILIHKGIESDVTVHQDDNLSLFLIDRINFANKSNADILVSLNLAFCNDPDANGSSCFYFKGAKSHSITGMLIANLIQDNLVKEAGMLDCRVHGASYAILKETVMTAVLVEPAFISNLSDKEKLSNTEFQIKISKAIVEALLHFLKE
ncbi:MAG: peptidoglycan-binding protein [Actinobacteria bacterium]|nr:peptidoglycan-binding protein [Actinomycetota bacterium]